MKYDLKILVINTPLFDCIPTWYYQDFIKLINKLTEGVNALTGYTICRVNAGKC